MELLSTRPLSPTCFSPSLSSHPSTYSWTSQDDNPLVGSVLASLFGVSWSFQQRIQFDQIAVLLMGSSAYDVIPGVCRVTVGTLLPSWIIGFLYFPSHASIAHLFFYGLCVPPLVLLHLVPYWYYSLSHPKVCFYYVPFIWYWLRHRCFVHDVQLMVMRVGGHIVGCVEATLGTERNDSIGAPARNQLYSFSTFAYHHRFILIASHRSLRSQITTFPLDLRRMTTVKESKTFPPSQPPIPRPTGTL